MSEYRKAIEKLIRDALGDFPQGFNAGAVAGVPGWAGDMAYMAQEYPRALLTDTPLRPPVEYAGTTDAIAKAAGYEIPGTLSGQLGAAVGGLLSPSPTDLAKFAPLLGAIPFWHGSPHKFDAFDLSKMGTGEGAQAYGWGAYGAETPATAQAYADNVKDMTKVNDLNAEMSRLADIMNRDEVPGSWRKYRTKEGEQAAERYDALMAQRESVRTAPGIMYRGEYAWPDPAKEAATPLTGEDLLQWDKPLSEQPKSLQEYPAKIDPEMWSPSGDDYDAAETGHMIYRRLHEMAIRSGKAKPAAVKEAEVAKALNKAGIPGIRYLDGQSRDGGSGTFNYVMFDDKGIKLLERNGKPIGGLLDKKR
jgi:hypothetical protein